MPKKISEEKNIPVHVVAVFAVVQKGNKFLIARRSDSDPQSPGVWSFPGGKVEMEIGKKIIETSLKREVEEEVGIKIKDNVTYLSSEGFIRVSGHHVVGLTFLCHWDSGEAKPLEDQEEVKWATLSELREICGLTSYMKEKIDILEKLFKNEKNN